MRRRRSIAVGPTATLGVVGVQFGVDIGVGQPRRARIVLDVGDRLGKWTWTGMRTQHATDKASDGIAIAGVRERRRHFRLHRDDYVDGLVHASLQQRKYNSFAMAVPRRAKRMS